MAQRTATGRRPEARKERRRRDAPAGAETPAPRDEAGRLAHWMQPVVDAIDHARVERVHRDPFQRDP